MAANRAQILDLYLPNIRGRYSFETNLSDHTWFQVGGLAEVFCRPEDISDLQCFLKNKSDVPYFVLGAGSKGVVIKLGRGF